MSDPTVPEPTGYRATSAELRRIADALDTLPAGDKPPYMLLDLIPAEKSDKAVDAIALAVGGKPGKTERFADGWKRGLYVSARTGRGYTSIHATVPGPPDERDAELERLRAEVAELRTKAAAAPRGWHVKGCLGAYGMPCRCPLDGGQVDLTGTPVEVYACCGRAGADAPHATFCERYVPEVAGLKAAAAPAPEPAAQHYEVKTWRGGPGNCGAECACGARFDGCDSMFEAAEEMAQHIGAEPASQTPAS